MTKKCEICGNNFETKKYGGKRKYCYQCSPEIEKGQTAISSIRRAIKQQLVLYKGSKCERCGYDKVPMILEFHHTDPENKSFEIGDYKYFVVRPMEEYYAEADKCEILCPNCHIEEHSK